MDQNEIKICHGGVKIKRSWKINTSKRSRRRELKMLQKYLWHNFEMMQTVQLGLWTDPFLQMDANHPLKNTIMIHSRERVE